jgi:hypothetical protein
MMCGLSFNDSYKEVFIDKDRCYVLGKMVRSASLLDLVFTILGNELALMKASIIVSYTQVHCVWCTHGCVFYSFTQAQSREKSL